MKLKRVITVLTVAIAAFATSTAHGADDLRIAIRTADDRPAAGAKVGFGMDHVESREGLLNLSVGRSMERWATPTQLPIWSDASGVAVIPGDYVARAPSPPTVYVRHEASNGVALVPLDRAKGGEPIRLLPACRVSGRTESPWLAERKRPLIETSVSLSGAYLSFRSSEQRFALDLPPGDYKLQVGGHGRGVGRSGTGGVPLEARLVSVTVRPGQRELDLGTIELTPTPLGKQVGQVVQGLSTLRVVKRPADIDLPAALKGHYLLLDFFDRGCGTCPSRARELAANYEDLHRRGLQVISIHSDVPGVRTGDDLADFLKGELWEDVRFPGFVCMDARGLGPDTHVLFDSLHVEAWPTLLLVGPDGTLLHVVNDGSVRELFQFSPILPAVKTNE